MDLDPNFLPVDPIPIHNDYGHERVNPFGERWETDDEEKEEEGGAAAELIH